MILFTVEENGMKQTFEGFCSYKNTNLVIKNRVLGVVNIEGSFELWWLDGNDLDTALDELERFYRMLHGRDIEVQTFRSY